MVKQNDTKNCQKENSLLNLNDEAFISFLYSERDRENNLNQVPGWSNWAIIGAIVAVLWTAYGIAKVGTIDVKSLLFYISGFIGLFWNYRSWANFFRRERGIDYGRVKLLKDVFPKVDVIMILICSLLMSVAIIHNHGIDIVAWFWLIIVFWYSFALTKGVIHRNTVVSSWFNNCYFSLFWQNVVFDIFASLLFCFISPISFKLISSTFICNEFELGLCIVAIVILVYILLKINFGNPSVIKFDVIIDDYLYKGVSKDVTYQKILINRMGYGVIEACENQIITIKELLKNYDTEVEKLNTIKDAIQNNNLHQGELNSFISELDASIYYQNKLIKESSSLNERVKQIIQSAPALKDVDSLNEVIDTNDMILDKIDGISSLTSDIMTIIRETSKDFLCQKYGGVCYNMECEKRNDRMSLCIRLHIRFCAFKHKKRLKHHTEVDS